jgi:hypothetical protein
VERLSGLARRQPRSGPAPGLAFETLDWIHSRQIAGICSDTWGIEVRPNDTEPDVFQPWHWVTIPAIGIVHGEIFYLEELAADCAADRIYEFFFCAPPLVITRGTGSPINPQAINKLGGSVGSRRAARQCAAPRPAAFPRPPSGARRARNLRLYFTLLL